MDRAPPAAGPGAGRARTIRGRGAGHASRTASRARGSCVRSDARPDGRDISRRARALRIVARLRDPDEAADHVAAARDGTVRDVRRRRRYSGGVARRRDDEWARAGLRRRVRAEPRARSRHRQADGEAHTGTAGRRRTNAAHPRARVRAGALGVLVRAARLTGERPDRDARARRQPLLRPRLYALAEALDAAEHRHRRRGGRCAALGRLGRRDREPDIAGALAVPDRLLLDAAALLGARTADPPRLRGRANPDAAGRPRRPRDDAPDRPVRARARRRHGGAVRLGDPRRRLPRRRARARRRLPLARTAAPPGHDSATRSGAFPLLAPVPGAAVRRDGARPGGRMSEPLPPRTTSEPVEATPEVAHKNVVLGWALFGISILIFFGAFGVSLIYLHFD